tara:strand:+ start:626 stop:1738 length:1113 start_codon:yes stop_codon:yes gene_type:complete
MTKENILNILKTVKYPGFERDIVSFGMVKDISISDQNIVIELNILTQNLDKKEQTKKLVEDALSNLSKKIIVQMSEAGPSVKSPTLNMPQPGSQTLANVKHIVAVASGKGGVGKSTVAANLACALKNNVSKVGLLDLDIYGPSLPIILGCNQEPKMTPEKKLIPINHLGMEIMSFGFISGNNSPTIWRGPLVARMTEQFFQDVEWGDLDIMVLDLPPGTGDVQLTLTQKLKISGAVIVTTPQDIALADVRKGADMFKKVNTPILGVVENMSGFVLNGEINNYSSNSITIEDKRIPINDDGTFSIEMDLFKTGGGEKESERLGVPLLGKIPILKDISDSTDEGLPIIEKSPNSSIGKIFEKIAQSIVSSLE